MCYSRLLEMLISALTSKLLNIQNNLLSIVTFVRKIHHIWLYVVHVKGEEEKEQNASSPKQSQLVVWKKLSNSQNIIIQLPQSQTTSRKSF